MIVEGVGTFGRPDMSGARGGGKQQKLLQRPDAFPYDKQPVYGVARGQGGHDSDGHHGVTPKNTEHSPWNGDMDEGQGSPSNSLMAQKSQIGGATGVPAAGGSWASGEGSWRDREIDDEELDVYGENRLPHEAPPIDSVYDNEDQFHVKDSSDGELEKKFEPRRKRPLDMVNPSGELEVVAGNLPSDIMIVGTTSPFMQGLGASWRLFRGSKGLVPEKSAWEQLEKMSEAGRI